MSRRRELERRLAALTEIAGILSAMKSLALMEIGVLGELIPGQRHMVAGIEQAAADYLAWHGTAENDPARSAALWIVIGSEQGFCGDFNDALLDRLPAAVAASASEGGCIVVGRRLGGRLADRPGVRAVLPGATVADEVPRTLLGLTDEINRVLARASWHGAGLSVLYHCAASGDIRARSLLPMRDLPAPAAHAYAPELTLPPADFLAGLTRHYLQAALNEILYSALLAENRHRQAHMERALQRLDDNTTRLRRACNAQRQEEITEEIELLLLSGDILADP